VYRQGSKGKGVTGPQVQFEARSDVTRSSRTETSSGVRKRTSLHPQTIRVQHRLAQWTESGRKHWDLYRWVLDPYVLWDATKLVLRNAGSPGLDREICESVRGNEWAFAQSVREELQSGSYRPGVVRRVHIPKRDGRKRPLGIPNLRDRVVQRALCLVLEPIYERVFLPCSYGFRPGKASVECVAQVAKAVYRRRHVLEADIEAFFDRVSHRKLLGCLKEKIVDPRVLGLIQGILKSGFQEWGKPWQPTEEGTPQGGPLSPMLSNIYLHYFLDLRFAEKGKEIPGVELIRFADDFIVVAETESSLKQARRCVSVWMREAGLKLKEEKTRVVDMTNEHRGHDSKFDFLGYKFHLRAYTDNRKRFWVARQPSEKARKSLHENLKAKLLPQLTEAEAGRVLAQVWRGWCNYFRYGNSNRIFYREAKTVKRLVFSHYLRRKYRNQRCPVPWRKLRAIGRRMGASIRPMGVIPDLLRQREAVQTAWA
jgi:RNA-directed DNA polymerase